ncbi:hypothetical protein L1987_02713 [Smallanthus sonchifolius]|uniref:Uncharacterized protein n=1 Tax=Smallanthus sonchifolius TaxID=185202 RepID=A0ACB9K8Q8_9ASTR|nr:hypothetical protein L1987_02713 [Smallanthus sonchifolius]
MCPLLSYIALGSSLHCLRNDKNLQLGFQSTVYLHSSTTKDSRSEIEDFDRAIAISLVEGKRKHAIIDDFLLKEDEHLAKALLGSLKLEPPHRNRNVNQNRNVHQPIPFPHSTSFGICAGCKNVIGHGRVLRCMVAVWHPECLKCHASNLPIHDYEMSTNDVGFVEYKACDANGLHCVPLYDTLGVGAVKYIICHADISIIFVEETKIYEGPANEQYSVIVTIATGTLGYCDPQYAMTHTLTKESDIYSFGVVLFEVLCGTLCYKYSGGRVQQVLVPMWIESYKQNKLEEIIFKGLIMQPRDLITMKLFSDIAYQCLKESREDRPKMAEVVAALETILRRQEAYDRKRQIEWIQVKVLSAN